MTEDELAHFGVKGMKWGVRNSATRADQKWEKKASSEKAFLDIHNAAATRMNHTEISRINNKAEYKDADFSKDSPLRRKYYKDYSDTFVKVMNEEAAKSKTGVINPSGTKKLSFDGNEDGDILIRWADIKHAEEDAAFLAKTDENGFIVSVAVANTSLTQAEQDDESLAHFGVKGMKWGVTTGGTASATKGQVVSARSSLKKQSTAYRKDFNRYSRLDPGSPQRAAFEKKLRDRREAYLKDPDRVIAARMTKGEKFTTALFSAPGGPASIAIAAASIATTSIVSRRIDYKQKTGAYNNASKTGDISGHLGLQKARSLTLYGASAAPALLSIAGAGISGSILAKANANRAAAKLIKPKSITGAASKIKYIKPSLRGVHKITTMT